VIIESRVGSFLHWMKNARSGASHPPVRRIREDRAAGVERAVPELARGDDPKTVLEALSHGLTNKLMARSYETPIQRARETSSLMALVARLYQLGAATNSSAVVIR